MKTGNIMKRLIISAIFAVVSGGVSAQTHNLTGRVTSTDGTPVPGVVVTDGYNCTQTDADGRYSMASDLSSRKFVYISVPADYEVPARHSLPAIFRRIPRYQTSFNADFVLQPRKEPAVHHTLIVQGDPQMRDFFVDNSAEAYRDVVVPEIKGMCDTISTPCYGIDLGDLIYNVMGVFPIYLRNTDRMGIVNFNVVGNHDHDQETIMKDSLGIMHYEMFLGPANYSVNIGNMHYVFVDNILFDYRKTPQDHTAAGIDDVTLHWLREDLKYVPKEKTIMICGHAQLFHRINHMAKNMVNFDEYSRLLLQYRKVYSWAGHHHLNFIYEGYEGDDYEMDNLVSITVNKSTGALRLNRELNNDGAPRGFLVVDVNGDDVSWYLHCIGHDRDYQMKVYPPARTSSEYVVAHIWLYDHKWSAVEWWENGHKVGTMEQFAAVDPDYVDMYATLTDKTQRKYTKPIKSLKMFRIKPSEGVTSGEVRVTDRFGRTYRQAVEW